MDRLARRFVRIAGVLFLAGAVAAGALPGSVGAQTPPPGVAYAAGFVPGSRTIFELNLAGEPLGEFPKSLRSLKGSMTMVQKDGIPMLKASNVSEFLVTLPEVLPQDFTLEFQLVPKSGGNPQDLSFEGTRTINQDVASAHILWDSDGYLGVIGGGESYETPMPEELRTTLPGVLTQVAVSFAGNTIKLYTNGKRLYTLDRQFARGRVLRVFLGGQDETDGAVHLAGLRIASNSPPALFAKAASGFVPGSRTLFDLNTPPPPPPPPGRPPKPRPGLRIVQGAWSPVQKDGMRMFKTSQPTEFLVTLLEPLPQDFTLEFELVPKECCNPQDLSFEGTPTIDQGDGSAHVLWDSDGYLAVIGGAPNNNYETPMPGDFKVILPGVLTEVTASFDGTTVKLYTNGRRLYTLTDRRFVRGKVLRVFLGAQNDTDQAVYLAKLRIATNSPPP
jgi:hypothetical protein